MIESRTRSIWGFALAGWLGAVAVMAVELLIFGPLHAADVGTARVLVPTAAAAIAIGWAFVMAMFAFRRFDEYQVAASKFAWYWGATIGIAFSGVAYTFVALGGLHWLDPAHFHLGRDLFRAFQVGYLVGAGFPFAGFLLAALWWRVFKR